MTDDERAIRDLLARWFEASRSGDSQTLLSLMTDDAVFLVPGRPPFGKDAFRQSSDAMKGVRVDGTSEIEELQIVGDLAFMRTRLRVTMTPADGPTITRAGYTLTILRKGPDGRWRLSRDANLLTAESST